MKLNGPPIRWLCFFGLLAAVGAAAFHFVRYWPRCTILANDEYLQVEHLSSDGGRLVIHRWGRFEGVKRSQPLEVFDTSTGRAVYTVSDFAEAEEGEGTFPFFQSPDHRYFVGLHRNHMLLVDWQNGQSWVIKPKRAPRAKRSDAQPSHSEISSDYRKAHCQFSPKSRWLIVQDIVLDVATREVVRGFTLFHSFIDERFALVDLGGAKIDLCVWDLEHDRLAWSLPTEIDWQSPGILATDDGRWLVIANLDEDSIFEDSAQRREMGFWHAELWDLRAKRRKLKIGGQGRQSWRLTIPRDAPRLAVWLKTERDFAISLIDLTADDDQLAASLSTPLRIQHNWKNVHAHQLYRGYFAPAGELFAFAHYEGTPVYTVVHAASNRVLWETREHSYLDFSPNGASVYCGGDNLDRPEQRDAYTGALQGKRGRWFQEERSSNGRFFYAFAEARLPEGRFWEWLAEHAPAWALPSASQVVVGETETGRELFRFGLQDVGLRELHLSDDGSTLVLVYRLRDVGDRADSVIQVWAVHPHRAYSCAVAASAVAGATLLLFRRWRRNRKATLDAQRKHA